jgi:hypothetical protein
MPLKIVPYQPEHEPGVAAFNRRAQAHDAPFSLSKTALSAWLPANLGQALRRELFLALDGDEVRGGFALRRQPFWLGGEVREVANYQGPLSEGLWDRRSMMAGVQMLRAALREQPLLYALGMGGMTQPLPKLLAAAGWKMAPVPFRFKVLRPTTFLRQIQPLRRTPTRALLLDTAAVTGAGSLAFHTLQWLRTKRQPVAGLDCEVVPEYGLWADEIWQRAKDGLALAAIRDQVTQNILFGDGGPKNQTLRCTRKGRDIGWAVVRSTAMTGDKYFGNMRVGSLVDALALPGQESAVLALAIRRLHTLGSDLVVTNQTHSHWLSALANAGFFSGPSNFIFACSPALSEKLGPLDTAMERIHFTRADGDGPIHL